MCFYAASRLLCQGAGKSPPRLALAGAGLLLGAAITFEYPAAVGAAALGAYALWPAGRSAGNRLQRVRWLLLGAALPLLGMLVYQWIAFGAPWSVGYAHLAPGADYAAGQAQG